MRTFAVVNMKGGVGKTTTAVQLAAGWARAGRRVLLVDADPPGQRQSRAREVRPGLDAITATPSAFTLDVQLAGVVQRETLLDMNPDQLREHYRKEIEKAERDDVTEAR